MVKKLSSNALKNSTKKKLHRINLISIKITTFLYTKNTLENRMENGDFSSVKTMTRWKCQVKNYVVRDELSVYIGLRMAMGDSTSECSNAQL